MKLTIRRLRWFFALVWRESTYTPPEMSRWQNRITIETAWEVSRILS